MNKLNKAQSKRFDEKFMFNKYAKLSKDKDLADVLKQHLESELDIQSKESYSKGFSDAYSNLKNTGVLPTALKKQKKEILRDIKLLVAEIVDEHSDLETSLKVLKDLDQALNDKTN